jgi:hypothetical protein
VRELVLAHRLPFPLSSLTTSGGSGDVPCEGGDKCFQSGHGGELSVFPGRTLLPGRQKEACVRVEILTYQFFTQNIISLRLGRILKIRKDRKMRASILYRFPGPLAILKKHKPADKRLGYLSESSCTKGSPEIGGGAYRFLATIIEIVSEGRSYLALQFYRRY